MAIRILIYRFIRLIIGQGSATMQLFNCTIDSFTVVSDLYLFIVQPSEQFSIITIISSSKAVHQQQQLHPPTSAIIFGSKFPRLMIVHFPIQRPTRNNQCSGQPSSNHQPCNSIIISLQSIPIPLHTQMTIALPI